MSHPEHQSAYPHAGLLPIDHKPSRWERFADTWRQSPAFERCLAVGMIAATVGTIVACLVIHYLGA